MWSKNKEFFTVLAASATVLGAGYWFLNRTGGNIKDPYDRSLVISVLKEFQREFNKLFLDTYSKVTNTLMALQQRGTPIGPHIIEAIKHQIVASDPELEQRVDEISDKIQNWFHSQFGN